MAQSPHPGCPGVLGRAGVRISRDQPNRTHPQLPVTSGRPSSPSPATDEVDASSEMDAWTFHR